MSNFHAKPAQKKGKTASRASTAAKAPGSRSPKHRGYRPEEAGTAAKKPRWSAEQRRAAGLGDRRGGFREAEAGNRADRSERADRNDRAERSGGFNRADRSDRAPRGDSRGGFRTERQGDAPRQGGYRGAGAARSGQYRDRPEQGQRFDRNDRGAGFNRGNDRRPDSDRRDDRGAQQGERSRNDWYPREQRGYARPGGDSRFRGASDRDRAPRGQWQDRPRQDHPRSDRPWQDRPARDDRAPRGERFERSDNRDRFDRAPRGDRSERSPRNDRFERPARTERGSDFYPSRDEAQRFVPGEDVVLERLEAKAVAADEVSELGFAELGLGNNIVAVLAELGAEKPFPIQAATIPDVLAGRDVLGRGRTGSGKTIAFGAPLVERLMADGGGRKRQAGRSPRALIMAPTRELAMQLDRTVQPIARSVGLFTTQVYGGVPQGRQVMALQRGVDIVIGTPGRIEDLIRQRKLDLSKVEITVLDEADHMCDLGFLEPVQRILDETGEGGQKLLFSATLDKGVATLVEQYLVDPAVYEVAGEDQASATIDHRVYVVEQREKFQIIEELASHEGKSLVFARTRVFAEQLTDMLEDAGIPAVSLHGDLNQARRTRNLEKLTSGRAKVLVATDVAARGIHVDDIELVVQADMPEEYKTYLHRSGRTGRAGKEGTVITLVTRPRLRKMRDLLDRAEINAEPEYVRAGVLPAS